MAKWKKVTLSKCPLKPSCYFRFLDDIFIIWENSEDEFWHFFDILGLTFILLTIVQSVTLCEGLLLFVFWGLCVGAGVLGDEEHPRQIS